MSGARPRVGTPGISTGNMIRDSSFGLVPETLDPIVQLNDSVWRRNSVRPAFLEMLRLRNARTVNCVFNVETFMRDTTVIRCTNTLAAPANEVNDTAASRGSVPATLPTPGHQSCPERSCVRRLTRRVHRRIPCRARAIERAGRSIESARTGYTHARGAARSNRRPRFSR